MSDDSDFMDLVRHACIWQQMVGFYMGSMKHEHRLSDNMIGIVDKIVKQRGILSHPFC